MVAGERSLIRAAGALFFVSGLAALVYQVIWQRILALHGGVGLYSVAMIVAAFMAGLGAGSLIGGAWSARLRPRAALIGFALLELGIAAFGAASPWIYYDWLYPAAVGLPSPSWQTAAVHLVALLPPTTLMGMSLPFLVRALVNDVRLAGTTIGNLYGANLMGAAAGALLTPWALLPVWGVRGAALAAAGANLIAGAGALALLSRLGPLDRPADTGPGSPVPALPGETPGGRPLGLWLALYALSGFVALSLEILWFRLMDVAVKSTAFTFGTLLAVYLLGNALGCLWAAPRVAGIRRPLRAFLLAQCTLLLLSGLAVVALVRLPPETPVYAWYANYWQLYGNFNFGYYWELGELLRLYVLLPAVLFLVPTILMGFSFPVLQRAVQDDARTSGRKVGLLQAANIAGSLAGSLAVGLASLQWLGSATTLRILLALGLAFAAVGLRVYGRGFLAPALALVAVAALVPGQDALWRRLHGLTGPVAVALFEEDATGVVAIVPHGARRLKLTINGKGNSLFPYGDVHTLLGALPALVHPAPRDVAVVGLGSGDSAWAVASRPETRSVTVYEISSPQPVILRRLAATVGYRTVQDLLADPRVTIKVEDGRKALERDSTSYDVIEIDAIRAESAGSGSLYSREFFTHASRRLKPGGLMCSWSPTPRVLATFRSVFPYVLVTHHGAVLIGSHQPLRREPETWLARLEGVRGYLGRSRAEEVRVALLSFDFAPSVDARDLNYDLFPRDEFGVPSETPR